MTCYTISSDQLQVIIANKGAELQSIKTLEGPEWLWQADPAIWPRHAPLLFPLVGRLKDDTLLHKDRRYRLTQHGFARDMAFDMERLGTNHCTLLLQDNVATRTAYPFAFELRVTYQIVDKRVNTYYEVTNTGNEILPYSIGAHPAFVWPLTPDVPKEDHRIIFAQPEAQPIRRLKEGLLLPDYFPTPIMQQTLTLNDDLFRPDVLLFDHINSRNLTYEAPGRAAITMGFPDFPHFGIWTKPGAGFICIEPWQGYASPQDFDGPFINKPGVVTLPPGATRTWYHWIELR